MSVKVFIIYAHEDQQFFAKLEKHLSVLISSGEISVASNQGRLKGNTWKNNLNSYLDKARIIVPLVSAHFLSSPYFVDNWLQGVLERKQSENVYVASVILSSALWEDTFLEQFQVLPTDTRPVASWSNQDDAFKDVVQGIQNAVRAVREAPQEIQNVVRESRDVSQRIRNARAELQPTSYVETARMEPPGRKVFHFAEYKLIASLSGIVLLTAFILAYIFLRGGSLSAMTSSGSKTPTSTTSPAPSLTTKVEVDTSSRPPLTVYHSSLIWNYTIGAYNNRLLMVDVVTGSSSIMVLSVTFHGVSLKLLAAQKCPTECRDEVWYVLNPPVGTASISVQTGDSTDIIIASAVSFYNVDLNNPFGARNTTYGRGLYSVVNVASSTKQLVVDFYGNQASPDYKPTAEAGQTQHTNVGDHQSQESASSTKVGTSPTTRMAWNWANTNDYADIGVALNPWEK